MSDYNKESRKSEKVAGRTSRPTTASFSSSGNNAGSTSTTTVSAAISDKSILYRESSALTSVAGTARKPGGTSTAPVPSLPSHLRVDKTEGSGGPGSLNYPTGGQKLPSLSSSHHHLASARAPHAEALISRPNVPTHKGPRPAEPTVEKPPHSGGGWGMARPPDSPTLSSGNLSSGELQRGQVSSDLLQSSRLLLDPMAVPMRPY